MPNTEIEVGDIPLNDIDPSIPRLSPALYELEIVKAEKAPNKDGTKENLNFEMKTVQDGTSTTGDPVKAGHTVFHTISITPTEKYTEAMIQRNCAALTQSAGRALGYNQFKNHPELLVGAFVVAKVGIQRETDEYPERNIIKGFVTKK